MNIADIERDLHACNTRGMFVKQGVNADHELLKGRVDDTYAEWCSRIGCSELLRHWDRDDYWITVDSNPTIWNSKSYGDLIVVAYSDGGMCVVPVTDERYPLGQLLVSQGSGLKRLNQTFSEWMCAQYHKHRANYGVRRWKYLMAGPKPFTPEEEVILANRLQWSVRILADQTAAPFGRILVEVTNGSQHHLDWLTTTFVEPKEWAGANWYDVKDIAPGQTAVRSVWSNEGKIRAEELILKLMPVNGPEDRRYVRELEGLVKEP
jgi:hypothetical protein